jgi:hypothetical protein
MKKYYLSSRFNHIKACIADSSTGRISLICSVNGLHSLSEQILPLEVDPAREKSAFELYLLSYEECSFSEVQPYIIAIQGHISSY